MIFRFAISPPLVDLARISWRRFQEERCLQIASSLTFTALLAIVPIMRAGLAMVEPLLRLLPNARVWHLGLYRDEETLRPVPYYNRNMRSGQAAHCIVVDPMLATGGSAVSAVSLVKEVGE